MYTYPYTELLYNTCYLCYLLWISQNVWELPPHLDIPLDISVASVHAGILSSHYSPPRAVGSPNIPRVFFLIIPVLLSQDSEGQGGCRGTDRSVESGVKTQDSLSGSSLLLTLHSLHAFPVPQGLRNLFKLSGCDWVPLVPSRVDLAMGLSPSSLRCYHLCCGKLVCASYYWCAAELKWTVSDTSLVFTVSWLPFLSHPQHRLMCWSPLKTESLLGSEPLWFFYFDSTK